MFFAVLLGLVLTVGSLFYSDKIALSTSGAQLVTAQDGPQAARLNGIVDRLCALANMPKPRVAIAPSPMLNAFATGRNSKTAVLVVTTGLLNNQTWTTVSWKPCWPTSCRTSRTRTWW